MNPAAGLLLACGWMAGFVFQNLRSREENSQLKLNIVQEKEYRQAERKGRIRAEQQLKVSQVSTNIDTAGGPQLKSDIHWPMRPIGVITSVFMQRNGTPRQPLLVPAARSRLDLHVHVPSTILDGLGQYTHCWVIYVFHLNTDLHQAESGKGIKGKVKPPRLNGQTMGVFATRTPHRPNPIGLSLCRIMRVGQNELILGGTDIVDGTPVLDVKPYIPFCECLPGASAPSWVVEAMDEEPLEVSRVIIADSVAEDMCEAMHHIPQRYASLIKDSDSVCELVRQMLSFDLRSLHHRQRDAPETCRVCVAGLLVDYAVYGRVIRVIAVSAAT